MRSMQSLWGYTSLKSIYKLKNMVKASGYDNSKAKMAIPTFMSNSSFSMSSRILFSLFRIIFSFFNLFSFDIFSIMEKKPIDIIYTWSPWYTGIYYSQLIKLSQGYSELKITSELSMPYNGLGYGILGFFNGLNVKMSSKSKSIYFFSK